MKEHKLKKKSLHWSSKLMKSLNWTFKKVNSNKTINAKSFILFLFSVFLLFVLIRGDIYHGLNNCFYFVLTFLSLLGIDIQKYIVCFDVHHAQLLILIMALKASDVFNLLKERLVFFSPSPTSYLPHMFHRKKIMARLLPLIGVANLDMI